MNEKSVPIGVLIEFSPTCRIHIGMWPAIAFACLLIALTVVAGYSLSEWMLNDSAVTLFREQLACRK